MLVLTRREGEEIVIVDSGGEIARVRLAELYPAIGGGWTKVECPTTKSMVSGNGRVKGAVVAPEVLLINGESLVDRAHLFSGGGA